MFKSKVITNFVLNDKLFRIAGIAIAAIILITIFLFIGISRYHDILVYDYDKSIANVKINSHTPIATFSRFGLLDGKEKYCNVNVISFYFSYLGSEEFSKEVANLDYSGVKSPFKTSIVRPFIFKYKDEALYYLYKGIDYKIDNSHGMIYGISDYGVNEKFDFGLDFEEYAFIIDNIKKYPIGPGGEGVFYILSFKDSTNDEFQVSFDTRCY